MIAKSSIPLSLRRFVRHRTFRVLFSLFVAWNAFNLLQIHLRLSRAETADKQLPRGIQRVYIASLHWNNEPILRSHWNDAVVALAKTLGPENVFITVYESGSWDDSKG